MTIAKPTQPIRSPLMRRVFRGGLWNIFGQFAPLVSNLILTPFIIHGLGVERYGLYMHISAVATFLGSFDGGISTSAQRYFAIYAGTDDRLSSTRLLSTL